MNCFELRSAATGAVVARRVARPQGWFHRTCGLLGRKALSVAEGLWLPRCWGIHTVGMHFPIDVLFLDEELRVLSVRANVQSGRFAVAHIKAHHVIELAAGTCARFDLLAGDTMVLSEARSQ
ncbi:MAG TPA: DUF192 domain-containing protein [Candidatus Baltobacteraceae bacterium]